MRKIISVFAFLFTISYQVNAQWIDFSSNLPTNIENISDIYFLSDQIGLISSKDQSIFPYNRRSIYRTTDGGDSWVEVFHDSANQQKNYSFNFINSDTGYAFSQNILLKTIDGGLSWFQIGLPVESTSFVFTVLSAHFIKNNIGWVGGRLIINNPPNFSWHNVIYRTTDAGINWSRVLTNQAVTGINKIFFAPGNRGYATDSES